MCIYNRLHVCSGEVRLILWLFSLQNRSIRLCTECTFIILKNSIVGFDR